MHSSLQEANPIQHVVVHVEPTRAQQEGESLVSLRAPEARYLTYALFLMVSLRAPEARYLTYALFLSNSLG